MTRVEPQREARLSDMLLVTVTGGSVTKAPLSMTLTLYLLLPILVMGGRGHGQGVKPPHLSCQVNRIATNTMVGSFGVINHLPLTHDSLLSTICVTLGHQPLYHAVTVFL